MEYYSTNKMRKKIIILLFSLGSLLFFGQEIPNKNEKFDLEIYEYLVKQIEKNSTTFEEFLENTKPFSKWDIRPLKEEKVWALDTIQTASQVPNLIFGAFSDNYKLTMRQALDKPNEFLQQGIQQKNNIENFVIKNLKNLNKLSSNLKKSSNQIFLNQKKLQKIDEKYKENNIYWSYKIPEKSPFPISNVVINEKNGFTKEQEKILNLLGELKIYAAVKTKIGIFYVIDGLTDNSYGIYYSLNSTMELNNILFEVMDSKKITDNYFYYIAN